MSVERTITRLWPEPTTQLPLTGLFLSHNLHDLGRSLSQVSARPLIYANFIASLDGRIAVAKTPEGKPTVPGQIANERDWRLFQELAAQADLLIASGSYMKRYTVGRAQEMAMFDQPEYQDLATWREANGLAPRPDLAVLSTRLDFEVPEGFMADGRRVLVLTSQAASPERMELLQSQGCQVHIAGEKRVEGRRLAEVLAAEGYQAVYSPAGPHVLHTLLAGQAARRLYLTLADRVLGGQPFLTMVEGSLLEPTPSFRLSELYYDPVALEGDGQLLLVYDAL
jgi:riboflavin biosynthesis pyrimidine reductase